jgi:hypothetical protein
MENQSAASRYARLASDRTIFLDTARDCAALSLPYLLTPTGVVNGQKLPTPWQSMGAKGVNVMASKLMLSLFPVNATFFKLQINDGKLSLDPTLSAAVKSEIDLISFQDGTGSHAKHCRVTGSSYPPPGNEARDCDRQCPDLHGFKWC